jgi:hypothetical protein
MLDCAGVNMHDQSTPNPETSMARFTLATNPDHAGRTQVVRVGNVTHYVECVPFAEAADITFRQWTRDYRRRNSRPFVTKRSAFASLDAAVKSLINA